MGVKDSKIMNTELEDDMNFLPVLISALIAVESGSVDVSEYRRDGVSANRIVGDNGKALGCLQIHKEVVADVNRIYKTQFKHEDALNPVLAKEICELYLKHYAGETLRRIRPGEFAQGDAGASEICARIWNGGPAGWKKTSTEIYWNKVKKQLFRPQADPLRRTTFNVERSTVAERRTGNGETAKLTSKENK